MSVKEMEKATEAGEGQKAVEVEEPWARMWAEPPPDVAVSISPAGARARAAEAIATHVKTELERGRSLYRIVHDEFVLARIGGFDGRALPPHCLEGLE